METILSINRIGKRFNAVQALHDVSFDVLAGECHAVMGENGAGKSTLMKILAGVITDYDGQIIVNGNAVKFAGTEAAEQAGIAIIHQELNLVEELNVAANIFLGRELHRWGVLNRAAMNKSANELLKRLQTDIGATSPVGSLRVGDQQLVEIAKALSLQASILIMDEPTSALTETEVARLYNVIGSLRSQGVTIIYISHKMDEVFRLADRITILRDGKFVQTVLRQDSSPKQIAHAMVGREIENTIARDHQITDEVVLEVSDLSLPWPGHSRQFRLQNISFKLHRGEVLGIAGLMGAGRTELLECLFGASEIPPVGTIRLAGSQVAFQHPSEAIQAGVAMVSEDRKRLGLFSHQTVRDNITIAMLSAFARCGVLSPAAEHKGALNQMQSLRVKADGTEAAITSLSGGNQQKCILGRFIMLKPKVLLLDDPTRGVDVGAKAEIYRLIFDLASQGMSIIVTSSELPEILLLSDRILTLCEGTQTAELSRAEATEQRIIEAITNVKP